MKASLQELSLDQGPNYNNTFGLQPDELWRHPNNDGHDQDPGYIQAHQEARQQLVDGFESGSPHRSADGFTELLKSAPIFLCRVAMASGPRSPSRTRHPAANGSLQLLPK